MGDGLFLMLAASVADLPRLARVEALAGLEDLPPGERDAWLETAFASAPLPVWLDRLHGADVGAAPCETIETLRSVHIREADGTPGIDRGSYAFSRFGDHPGGHAVTQLDPCAVRPTLAPLTMPTPAEKYGASTRSILSGIGLDEAATDAVLASGAAGTSWSREYLPS